MKLSLPLALLLLTSTALAAPAPDRAGEARRKLEALKKKLPNLLKTWNKSYIGQPQVTVRRLRLIGDGQAKLVIGLDERERAADTSPPNHLLTIYLTYYDGLWTATGFQLSDTILGNQTDKAAHFLMDAIDEAAEKK